MELFIKKKIFLFYVLETSMFRNYKSVNAYNYIHIGNDLTEGRFNNPRAHSLYRVMVMETSVMGGWTWEILCLMRELDLLHSGPVC